jgi:hypothetical protein
LIGGCGQRGLPLLQKIAHGQVAFETYSHFVRLIGVAVRSGSRQ